MLRFKLAVRIFRRNLLNSLISLFGLALGFCCFILVTLYHDYETGFDQFNENSDRIYRIIEHRAEEGHERTVAATGPQVGVQALAQLPEVEAMTEVIHIGRFTLGNELALRVYEEIYVMDSTFFDVFSYQMLLGDARTALTDPGNILLSESLARKHFQGDLPALGDSIYNNVYTAEISGVFADPPPQSHLQFKMIVPAAVAAANFPWWNNFVRSDWENNSFSTYVRLTKEADPNVVSEKITTLVRPNYPEELQESTFELQALDQIHFEDQAIEGSLASNTGNRFYMTFLSILGILVLVVAAFNFTNITTALALRRTREIGLRKTVGAGGRQVIGQFLSESFIMVLLAALLAIFLADLLLEPFNSMMGTSMVLSMTDVQTMLIILGVSVLVGMLASSYPAWIVGRVVPAEAIRNKYALKSGGMSVRKILVVAQFAVAILMITSTLVIYRQLSYMQQLDLGFARENLTVIDINSGNLRGNFEAIKNEMLQIPGVESVSVTSRVPGEWKVSPVVTASSSSVAESRDMRYLAVDKDFLNTFGIDVKEGSGFTGDLSDSLNIMINEQAVRTFGLTDPVGEDVTITTVNWGGDIVELETPFRARVIGIVNDFHFESMHHEIKPMVLAFRNNPIHNIDYFTVRMAPGNTREKIAALNEVNSKFDPENPMEYHFLDQQFNRFFTDDEQRARIFAFFSVIVILISCMGLFALASHEIRQRMKEVGVRKVLGASVSQIILLFARNFSLLVAVGFLIAAPLAWWITTRWLNEYAYRFDFSTWMLAIPGILILLLALLTVGLLTLRAARSNPVNVIRNDN